MRLIDADRLYVGANRSYRAYKGADLDFFDPRELGNLALWYDAFHVNGFGVANGADGTAVAQWNDLSGSARHAVQAVAGNQPKIRALPSNTTLPCVRWDGGDTMPVTNGGSMLKNLAGASAYLMGRQNSVAADHRPFYFAGGVTTARYGLIFQAAGGLQNGMRRLDADSVSLSNGTRPAVSTNFVASTVANFAAATHGTRVNGGTEATGVFASGGNTSNTDGTISNLGNGAGSAFWNGDICAFLVFQTAHNAATRSLVERWLGRRYGAVVA